jgi:hypothetical protein
MESCLFLISDHLENDISLFMLIVMMPAGLLSQKFEHVFLAVSQQMQYSHLSTKGAVVQLHFCH